MRKIFISHSSRDKKYVGHLIRLLEGMEIPTGKIFCSSFEGYGIPLGDYFLETLKEELNEEILAIFLLSEDFYSSPVCLCEMGAVWIKTNIHIPVLIPPFEYEDMRGVISSVQGMVINDKSKLNSLYNQIRKYFDIAEFDINRWETRRDAFIMETDRLISEQKSGFALPEQNKKTELPDMQEEYRDILMQSKKEVAEFKRELKGYKSVAGGSEVLKYTILERAHQENNNAPAKYANAEIFSANLKETLLWKKCLKEHEEFCDIIFDARGKLDSLPAIVRKVLYYYCSGKEFIISNSDEGKELDLILEAVEDDYLLLEGRVAAANMKDPKIRKAIESLINLKCFLSGAAVEFHNAFEAVYEICAKIESRKFWTTMGLL